MKPHDVNYLCGGRGHRLGRRDLSRMVGHWWQTVVEDSVVIALLTPIIRVKLTINEAYVYDEEGLRYPVVIVCALFSLDSPQYSGQLYGIVLEPELGRSVINCETIALGNVTTVIDGLSQSRIEFGADCNNPQHRLLNHGITRNTWDGEVAVGLLERSVSELQQA